MSKTWNSINPATLSGAIDVIVVEQENGTNKSHVHAYFINNHVFRIISMLPISRPLWKVLPTEAI